MKRSVQKQGVATDLFILLPSAFPHPRSY
jgi:hypothetical protein